MQAGPVGPACFLSGRTTAASGGVRCALRPSTRGGFAFAHETG